MSAFAQKIILTVLAVGIYALCAWPPMAVVAEVLKVLAGLIVGAVWITKPGDGALVEAGKQAIRRSVPPVALVLAVLLLASCTPKQAHDVKNVARRVNDIARMLCEATMGADAAKQGLSVADLCLLPHVIGPFLQAPRIAAANAKAGASVEPAACTP